VARAQKLDTEEQKTIYALGLAVARNLQAFNLSPDEVATMRRADRGTHRAEAGGRSRDLRAKLDPLAKSRPARARRGARASAAYLKSAAAESGAKTTPSGLVRTAR
jgi:FKBP-type peptidyl-prolyl cis-trans isomerase FkpA